VLGGNDSKTVVIVAVIVVVTIRRAAIPRIIVPRTATFSYACPSLRIKDGGIGRQVGKS
jgi:hypothetical protein